MAVDGAETRKQGGLGYMIGGLVALVLLVFLFFRFVPNSFYLWVKSFHVIAIIAWMAGLLYLPRLFVYHADAEVGSVQSETFKTMERRLHRAIITPAMALSWILGLWLAWRGFGFSGGWLHAKIAAVFILSGFTGYFSRAVRDFLEDRNTRSSRHWRILNEIPALLMIAIVILVVVKPF